MTFPVIEPLFPTAEDTATGTVVKIKTKLEGLSLLTKQMAFSLISPVLFMEGAQSQAPGSKFS